MDDKLLEDLANLAHEQWSGWMYYMFSKCVQEERFENGEFFKTENLIIPRWAVERWTRQMNTKYKDLSEEEKNSDREEAERVIGVLKYNKII
jgi:hypothetical protein